MINHLFFQQLIQQYFKIKIDRLDQSYSSLINTSNEQYTRKLKREQAQGLKSPESRLDLEKQSKEYLHLDFFQDHLFLIFEKIWKIILIIVSVICLFMLHKIYQFRSLQEFKDLKKGNCYTFVIYGAIFTIVFYLLDKLWHYYMDQWIYDNYIISQKFSSPQACKNRSYSIARWGYFIIFYSLSSISGYLIIKDTSFFPTFLGGSGSIYTLNESRYLKQATWSMELYYFVQCGKHIARSINHMFIRPDGSYFQYTLHHAMSVFLIFFSYAGNMWIIGIFVFIVHDCADAGLILGRAYRDYRHRNKITMNVTLVFGALNWIFMRNILFNYCLVYATWYQYLTEVPKLTKIQQDVIAPCYLFLCIMLTCLQFMHIFWTWLIIKSVATSNSPKKMIKHNYD